MTTWDPQISYWHSRQNQVRLKHNCQKRFWTALRRRNIGQITQFNCLRVTVSHTIHRFLLRRIHGRLSYWRVDWVCDFTGARIWRSWSVPGQKTIINFLMDSSRFVRVIYLWNKCNERVRGNILGFWRTQLVFHSFLILIGILMYTASPRSHAKLSFVKLFLDYMSVIWMNYRKFFHTSVLIFEKWGLDLLIDIFRIPT